MDYEKAKTAAKLLEQKQHYESIIDAFKVANSPERSPYAPQFSLLYYDKEMRDTREIRINTELNSEIISLVRQNLIYINAQLQNL